MTRTELQEKIDLTRAAILHAGAIHRKDLQRHLRRLLREARDYDRFQETAKGRNA